MKTATHSARLLFALVAGLTGAVLGSVGTASAVSSESYQISPPTANYAADHGQTISGTVKVTNLTDTPLTVNVTKQNFVAKGEEGEIELVNNADPLYSLAPWFNFSTSELTVPPRGTTALTYTIALPLNAEPGGRYGSIVFDTIPPKLPGGQSGAAVEQQIASIVFLRINGAAKEQLGVASFQTGHQPLNQLFQPKTFFEYGPVNFLTRVKNTGTVHEKPTGTITIKNMLGFTVATIPLDQHFVIPGAVRRLHNTWPTGKSHPFLLGSYTAHLSATYTSGKTLSATTTFLVLPWKQLLVILIMLIVIVWFFWRGRKRLGRALRILAGRE